VATAGLARLAGLGWWRSVLGHVARPVAGQLTIISTLSFGDVVISIAALSFLGLGVRPPTPEWGAMLSDSRGNVAVAPWLLLAPGLAIVLSQQAAVFVDGRYTLQAGKQVDRKAWQVEPLVDPPPEHWLAKHLEAGDRLGFDPWLHTSAAAERLAAACAKAGAELIAVETNPLDQVWTERPAPPLGPVAVHGMQFSGEIESEKLKRIRIEISKLGVDALVLSDSHAVAWTFNIRGADVAHTPLPLSYALVPKDGRPTVFIDHRKLSNATRDHLEQSADVREPSEMAPQLMALAKADSAIALDSATAADALSRLITAAGGKPVRGNDPVSLLKAVKNQDKANGGTRNHAEAMSIDEMKKMMDWSEGHISSDPSNLKFNNAIDLVLATKHYFMQAFASSGFTLWTQ